MVYNAGGDRHKFRQKEEGGKIKQKRARCLDIITTLRMRQVSVSHEVW